MMLHWITSRHGNKSRTRVYPPKPNSIWQVFSVLTGFGYEFKFCPILKHVYGTGNEDIGTHPKLIPKPLPNVEN